MKKYFLFLLLVACSSQEQTQTTENPPSPAPEPLIEQENALSTPVDTKINSEQTENPFSNLSEPGHPSTPASAEAISLPTPEAELPLPHNETKPSAELLAQPQPEAPVPQPSGAESKPNILMPQKDRKSTAELLDEYEQKREDREKVLSEIADRSLIPHEGGNFQIGLDFTNSAFPNYDFDKGAAKQYADTQGAFLSFHYFPLHSLSFGRLGLGARAGAFWTKFSFATSHATLGTVRDESRVHSFDVFGGRITYELQYFLGQILVPHAFIGIDQVRVRPYSLAAANINFSSNSYSSTSYGGGAYLNLNRLEPTAAGSALANIGVRKFYLAYTYEQHQDSSDSGSSHLLGLRFEY